MNLKFDGEMVQAEWHDVACAALSTLMVLLTILILI